MLIPLRTLVNKYNIKIKGVIHIGGHFGQEYDDYKREGVQNIVFVEPCGAAMQKLFNRMRNDSSVKLYQYACGSKQAYGKMNTASFNKGESNSLLEPYLHLVKHPEVVFDGDEDVQIVPLDNKTFFDFTRSLYDFMNIDVQGYELEVLRGATEMLKYINHIYIEVNKLELYRGCAMVEQLDEFLIDFKRVETEWAGNTGWGDALYIRHSLL